MIYEHDGENNEGINEYKKHDTIIKMYYVSLEFYDRSSIRPCQTVLNL